MTTDKSKKGLMGGKLEMMNRPLRFIQFSMPAMSAMPAMSVMPAMPPGISGSDNAPKKPEHLRKKTRKRS